MLILPLLLFLGACTEPVVVIEEPAEVETCEWLIPVGIELVNDYFYTLLETDLGPSEGNQALLPDEVLELNIRGRQLDARAAELGCDLDELNRAIVAATSGLETADPVGLVFLETVRSGVFTATAPYGEWQLAAESTIVPVPDHPITMTVDEEAATGDSGCNGYYFPLIIENGEWVWDESRAATNTELMCHNDSGDDDTELAAQETAYLAALAAVTSFEIVDETLVLRGPGVELRYSKIP